MPGVVSHPARMACVLGAALILGAVALALGAAEANAQVEARWRAFSREMAAPWPEIQRETGNLPDYLDGLNNPFEGTRYGDAMMGWGLLQVGIRDQQPRMINAGLAAIGYATSSDRHWGRPSLFETMAVASAYNLVREPLADDPRFRRLRRQWETWLKRVRTERLHYENRYGNHWLVDAISVFELQRSGLRSNRRGTVLGTGRTTARRQAIRLINIRIPRLVAGNGPLVLSDPPDQPIAYHGLSIAFYARAMRLMGPLASKKARSTLRRAIRGSQLLAAPDGDISYITRSQEEVWTLPATAYATQFASQMPGTTETLHSDSHALAERTLQRLRREYVVGPRGIWVTPALAQDLAAGARGLDAYAGAPAYGGLALVWLNLTIEEHPEDPPAADLPADGLLATPVSQAGARFAVVRRPALWFAIKMTHSQDPHFVDDLRYDFGLAVVKRRRDGGWTDIVPQRPRSVGANPETAGPILVDGGRRGHPFGTSIKAARNGVVTVTGGFRTTAGAVMRQAVFTYRPVPCGGVELSFAALDGDVYELSGIFRGLRAPEIQGAVATAGGLAMTINPRPAFGRASDAGASGFDAHLMRQPMTIRVPESGTVSVTYCEPAAAAE
jgi:hypothetical protein